jgi:hypothetical protein
MQCLLALPATRRSEEDAMSQAIGGIPVGELHGLVTAPAELRAPRYYSGFLRAADGEQIAVRAERGAEGLSIRVGRETVGALPRIGGHYGGCLVEGGETLVAFHVSGNAIAIVTEAVASKHRTPAVEARGAGSIEELAKSIGEPKTASAASRFRKA